MCNNIDITTERVLELATEHLNTLIGHTFDVINIAQPNDENYARFLTKVVSKLSPIVGNMIEEQMSVHLNTIDELQNVGKWVRQDPGFPDNIFESDYLNSTPGIEVKAWFPLATEITGRFKTSQNLLTDNSTLLALVVWMPEFILYGRPKIIDIWIGTAHSIALARDSHYFDPPRYLVIEPQDTTTRTANLQQQNVEGYVFQPTTDIGIEELNDYFRDLGLNNLEYPPNQELLQAIERLRTNFQYRLDTNFAKLNRLQHAGINEFKRTVLDSELFQTEHSIRYWSGIQNNEIVFQEYLQRFPIVEEEILE